MRPLADILDPGELVFALTVEYNFRKAEALKAEEDLDSLIRALEGEIRTLDTLSAKHMDGIEGEVTYDLAEELREILLLAWAAELTE